MSARGDISSQQYDETNDIAAASEKDRNMNSSKLSGSGDSINEVSDCHNFAQT
ncbi:Hypothetical protein CINCED_3A010179 [Cinara cedri]|uniref:Uncharacterized protein n=1 Tax=Cinara cedri TaxID=506608 RepID=A0A5E4N2R2_9HEMI|nr:Hypothetical protein CINCED_3A010179 [Cinara cedri]